MQKLEEDLENLEASSRQLLQESAQEAVSLLSDRAYL